MGVGVLPELRIGVVGAGWAAREHSSSVARLGGATIAGVFDIDAQAAEKLAGEFGGPDARAYPSLDDLLGDELDAIIVATPSGLHRLAVEPALDLGISVFVEKPLSRTIEDAEAIADAAARSSAVCAVGYQWRALEPLLGLRDRLRDESIALMISQGVAVTQSRPWFADSRLSGGLLFERVSHHIDLQRMLAGEVSHVTAVRGAVPIAGSGAPADDCDDVISLTLGFESGAIGAVHVVGSPTGYPVTQATRVFTTGDAYDFDLDPVFSFHSQGQPAVECAAEPPFICQMRRFLEATRTRDPALVCCSAADAAGTVKTAAAAERSLAQRTQISVADRAAPAPDKRHIGGRYEQ